MELRCPVSASLYAGFQISGSHCSLLCFSSSVGCVSFCFAMFAKELLFVGSAFFGGMALSVASIARFCASALAPLAESVVGVDHHGPRIGGGSSLVCFGYLSELLPGHICGVCREPFVVFLSDELGHFLACCLFAVEYRSPSVR